MTAGVAATRALFPLNGAITSSDSIISSHTLSSPFGRAIAYTALYEGAHFCTTETTAVFKKREGTSISVLYSEMATDHFGRFTR